ncbi:uncharacterized protein LOC135847892 [Planococcus citri]|uniref:uncharacterized protein LOC135847892 n=1 Tax=Planococcus citri TaxID=170843 RepID=UPI0031FA2242
MAIKTTYLISCLVLLANCNIYATCTFPTEDCDESKVGSTGYFASGSAHSSQYVLPSGEVVTHSKGSSISSADGIKKTFEHLKHEANQFVSKQADTLNIPNALPPLHSSYGQDLQSLQSSFGVGDLTYPSQAQGYFSKLESANHQKQFVSGAGSQNAQVIYHAVPQTKIVSTKKEQVVNKKVITHGSNSYGASSGLEEIETSQNGLDSNLNTDGVLYQSVPSYVQTGNTHQEEIETVKTNAQLRPVVIQKIQQAPSQISYSKHEQQTVKQNSSSQLVPGLPGYIPNGQFTTGVVDLNTFVGNRLPAKQQSVNSEKHYSHNEDTESSYYEGAGSSASSDVNIQQKEHKYNAVPYNQVIDRPVKIKYVYDGKTLHKMEEYSSGAVKNVPITVEEYENTLKEIQQQSSSHASQSYVSQPVSHEKPESDGYYYYPKAQGLSLPSNTQTIKKEESQSSHSQQTITNGNVEQFSHLPLNVNSQKQYATHSGYTGTQSGYAGVVPPASSQINYFESGAQSADAFNLQNENPAILVRGVPQLIPVQNQQHSSSSSGSTFHSSSYSGSNGGSFVFPADSITSSHTSGDVFEKLSSLNTSGTKLLNCGDCLTGLGASNLPVKNSYGIATSFSSSSSNINGKKTENRQASVSVNDNGKVDTYNVKS